MGHLFFTNYYELNLCTQANEEISSITGKRPWSRITTSTTGKIHFIEQIICYTIDVAELFFFFAKLEIRKGQG